MTLRNAFEGLATEGTLKRILSQLGFARDANDRLRVIVDGNPVLGGSTSQIGYIALDIGTRGGIPVPWGQGSPNSVDQREQLRETARIVLNQRMTRWTF